MVSPLMGERCQFENWGRPLGGTDFRLYAAEGKAPIQLIPQLTPNLFLTSRTFYSAFHAYSTTHFTQFMLPISRNHMRFAYDRQ